MHCKRDALLLLEVIQSLIAAQALELFGRVLGHLRSMSTLCTALPRSTVLGTRGGGLHGIRCSAVGAPGAEPVAQAWWEARTKTCQPVFGNCLSTKWPMSVMQ